MGGPGTSKGCKAEAATTLHLLDSGATIQRITLVDPLYRMQHSEKVNTLDLWRKTFPDIIINACGDYKEVMSTWERDTVAPTAVIGFFFFFFFFFFFAVRAARTCAAGQLGVLSDPM